MQTVNLSPTPKTTMDANTIISVVMQLYKGVIFSMKYVGGIAQWFWDTSEKRGYQLFCSVLNSGKLLVNMLKILSRNEIKQTQPNLDTVK